MRPLSPRESRLVALLILVALVSLVLLVIIGPLVGGFRDRAQQRDMLAARFLANEQRIASLRTISARAEAQQGEMRALFITAPDGEEADEALRERIETAAQSVGANVKATEAIPGSADGWARASLEVQATEPQLAGLLARLNQLQPAVAIETMTATADDAQINLKSETINVRLEASAPFLRAQ